MIPVYQKSDNDCFPACISSITGIPIDEIPNIAHLNNKWFGTISEWLGKHGWMSIYFDNLNLCAWLDGCYCIVTGKSPRGNFNHSVVGIIKSKHDKEGLRVSHEISLIHDPHPSNSEIENVVYTIIIFRKI